MKTQNLTSLAVLLAALSATAGFAGPVNAATKSPYAFPVSDVRCIRDPVMLGATERQVIDALGGPHRRPSGDIWIYRDIRALKTDRPDERGCTLLVVTFSKGRVADMKLVNSSAAKLITAGRSADKPIAYVVDRTPGLHGGGADAGATE